MNDNKVYLDYYLTDIIEDMEAVIAKNPTKVVMIASMDAWLNTLRILRNIVNE